MSFGKSRARLLNESQNKVTFDDVAGIDEAKDEVEEIIAFLKDPKKFQRLGGRIPKGVLLMGPPGTGKTLLARAIAGEAGVPFFSISGSDFVEMFVGVGASRVRDLFEQGKKNAPCIIFIDEIDAVGRHRGAGLGGGHDEREQTLNQLLVEMDGFESNEGVILIAATNRPDVLDPALLRPGRFDRRIVVPRPDVKGREGILAVHTRASRSATTSTSTSSRAAPRVLGRRSREPRQRGRPARRAPGQGPRLHGRLRDGQGQGPDGLGAPLDGHHRHEKRKTTAYHEAGHALVAAVLPTADPVHKVTIIPRGPALGVTMALPEEDRQSYSAKKIRDRIAMALGGRLAEEVVFGQLTTGAADDFKKATQLARSMVTEWGMSERLGPLSYVEKEESGFLGPSYHKDYSEQTAKKIDNEIKRIISEQYDRAKQMLLENRDKLDAIAEALLERETLDREEIEAIMTGEDLPPPVVVTVPTYAEKRRESEEKRKGAIFQPRPREVPERQGS